MEDKLDEEAIQIILAGIDRGISASEYSSRMSKNISLWKNISYLDVKKILTLVHDSPLGVYTIVPFFYKQLGIDLREFYLYMNNNVWHNQDMTIYVNNFNRFPLWMTRSDCEVITSNFYQLKIIRNNLLNQGAKIVKEITILALNGNHRKQQHPLDLESLPVDHLCYDYI